MRARSVAALTCPWSRHPKKPATTTATPSNTTAAAHFVGIPPGPALESVDDAAGSSRIDVSGGWSIVRGNSPAVGHHRAAARAAV